MRNRVFLRFAAVAVAAVAVALLVPATQAGTTTTQKAFAEPNEEDALVYFIRTKRFSGSGRTMFLYADDRFLGVLDNDSYTFAHIPPGERFLWLNWARINRTVDLQAGETYYFVVWDTILDVTEEVGLRRIEEVKSYCQPTDKEIKTSEEHIRKRSDKAVEFAEKDTGERAGSKADREKHIAKWPEVDLSGYSILVIEDFAVTDPKASQRKNQDLLSTAPSRVANLVRSDLDKGTFDEVRRERTEGPLEGALILRVELTQYKPGSAAGRFMIAGAGAARLDFLARLIDGATGEELATFSDERAYGWGGAMGAAGGIETIEKNLAYELAVYLERQVQGATAE